MHCIFTDSSVSCDFSMRHAFLALLVSISVGALPTAGVGSQTYYPDYALYHDVDRYNSEVQQLAALYPACVSLEESGQSRNGDKLYLVKVTDRRSAARSDGSTKKRLPITTQWPRTAQWPPRSWGRARREPGVKTLCELGRQRHRIGSSSSQCAAEP